MWGTIAHDSPLSAYYCIPLLHILHDINEPKFQSRKENGETTYLLGETTGRQYGKHSAEYSGTARGR
jgi:hypothetical protein